MESEDAIWQYRQAAIEFVRNDVYGQPSWPLGNLPKGELVQSIRNGPREEIDFYCNCVRELSYRIYRNKVEGEEIIQAVGKMVEVLSSSSNPQVLESITMALTLITETPDEGQTKVALKKALGLESKGFPNWRAINKHAAIALAIRGDPSGLQAMGLAGKVAGAGNTVPLIREDLGLLLRAITGERSPELESRLVRYLNSYSQSTSEAALFALLVMGKEDLRPVIRVENPDFGLSVVQIVLARNGYSGQIPRVAEVVRRAREIMPDSEARASHHDKNVRTRSAIRSILEAMLKAPKKLMPSRKQPGPKTKT